MYVCMHASIEYLEGISGVTAGSLTYNHKSIKIVSILPIKLSRESIDISHYYSTNSTSGNLFDRAIEVRKLEAT